MPPYARTRAPDRGIAQQPGYYRENMGTRRHAGAHDCYGGLRLLPTPSPGRGEAAHALGPQHAGASGCCRSQVLFWWYHNQLLLYLYYHQQRYNHKQLLLCL